MKEIKDRVFRFLKNKDFKTIYTGFSGGADSTCLLHILNEVCIQLKAKLAAVHFEHGLRGEYSKADAKWCRDFCLANAIEFIEFSLDIQTKVNTEALARELRYRKFRELIKYPENEVIALGHHKGDKIENFFLRLVRGGNSTALTSLRKESEVFGLKIIRPLLDFTKEEIEKYLISNGINDWRIDHTNNQSEYNRNFFRNEILGKIYSKIPASKTGMIRSMDSLLADADFIEKTAKEEFIKYTDKKDIPADILSKMHDAVLIRFMRYWISKHLGFEFIPNRNFIERLKEQIETPNSEKKFIPLKNSKFLYLRKGILSIEKDDFFLENKKWNWKDIPELKFGKYNIKAEILYKKDINLKDNKNTIFFDYDCTPDDFIIRTCREGDRIVPFSRNSTVKLKKIFNDRKITSDTKTEVPLVCLPDETIIWIVGIKRSSFAPVIKSTNQILKLTYRYK